MGDGRIRGVLASSAKRKALCNLGHCKEQLEQPSPARGPIPANSPVATPLNLSEAERGGWAGRMLGSAFGKSEEGRGGELQSCHRRPECWGLSGKGWCVGRNGDSDLMWSHYFITFLCLLGEHSLFIFQMSVLLSRLVLWSSILCVCVCRLSLLFCWFEVTVSFNGALRASQKHFTCLEKLLLGCWRQHFRLVFSRLQDFRIVWKWSRQICACMSVLNYIAIGSLPLAVVP